MSTQIRLRALEPDDIELLYSWENNPSVWFLSNTIAPFSKHILTRYLEESHNDIFTTKQLRLIIELVTEETQTAIGAVDLFDYDPLHMRAGIGILIADEKYRKKGYGKKALTQMTHYSFNVLFLHQLYCNITNDNDISMKLFTSCGFEIIGEKKEWLKCENGWKNEYMLQLINPSPISH